MADFLEGFEAKPRVMSGTLGDGMWVCTQAAWEGLMVQYMRRNAERHANLTVAAPTTPAQLFHILRRQVRPCTLHNFRSILLRMLGLLNQCTSWYQFLADLAMRWHVT